MIKLKHNPEDDWAEVELFRWQYGKLPQNDDRKLDISKALINMSKAIESGCKNKASSSEMPTPFNVSAVLEFCARKLEKN